MYYRKHYDKHKCKKKLQEGRRYRPSGYYYKEDGKGEIYYYRYYWSTTNKIMKRITSRVIRNLTNDTATNARPGEYKNHHDDWCYW